MVLSAAELIDLAWWYEVAGMSAERAGVMVGVSRKVAHRLLVKTGVELRPKGRARWVLADGPINRRLDAEGTMSRSMETSKQIGRAHV